VRFAERDVEVERFATYRSDQAFDVPVLRRRACCCRVISDLHCTNSAGVRWTECSVAVANQVTRCFVPAESVNHLTCDYLLFPRERSRINRENIHRTARPAAEDLGRKAKVMYSRIKEYIRFFEIFRTTGQ